MNFDPRAFSTETPLKTFEFLGYRSRVSSDINAWSSDELSDAGWDQFISSSTLGQFQQSSLWAAGKCDGPWKVMRVALTRHGLGTGGFQILYRNSPIGLIGYVSKGPVLYGEQDVWESAADVLKYVAVLRRFRALVVQPPDRTPVSPNFFRQRGFIAEKLLGVVDASLWFELSGSPDSIMDRMPAYNRTFIRQAIRRGVTVREGGESDVPLFFQLMIQTCKRQGVSPNPNNINDLTRIWRSFHSQGAIRMAFAESDGKVIAALSSFAFGDRVTLWKKGWTAAAANLRPNHLLYYDTLCWAQQKGAKFCDFYAARRDIIETLLSGAPLSAEQSRSRDRFHLGFGGKPVLLPPAVIFFPNPVFRIIYRMATMAHVPKAWNRLRSLLRG